eukprot:2568521-Rhodomonas_salina.1
MSGVEGEPRASKQRPSATATAERGGSVRAVYDRGRGRSVRASLELSPPLLTAEIPTHSATCPHYSSPVSLSTPYSSIPAHVRVSVPL